ncbi:MAG: nucleotide exchange factor GrpE [Candidatus Eisenbacteria bacterium]|nr:nucleotide exchange factor GrpE [Candidatus Eisenbacteria bacterium]
MVEDGTVPQNGGIARDDGSEEVAALREELAALNDKWLRALADLDNYKRRTERERCRWADQAREDVLASLLSVVDDLDRALACGAPEGADGGAALRAGVELIRRQLLQLLEKHGVVPIETGGAEFDPAFHEAVCQLESPDHDSNQIVSETQKGYRLGDRVLRCSKVVVAK